MAVLKCKMCGGTIEFEKGTTVGECDSCGTKQTLPRIDSEKKQIFTSVQTICVVIMNMTKQWKFMNRYSMKM